jgi:hypothetical protein
MEAIQKIIKDITLHFEEEINLRRDIIEKEKNIEKLKQEQYEQEYEIYKSGGKDSKDRIAHITKEIDKIENTLNGNYTQQYELRNKRAALQNAIKFYRKDFASQLLTGVYQYHIGLLENITLEHRKNVNLNLAKSKELQIDKLTGQIQYRDEFINQADSEFRKKLIKFKQNENIKTLEQLNSEPIRLPLIKQPSSANIGTVKGQLLRPVSTHSIIFLILGSYDYELTPLKKRKAKFNSIDTPQKNKVYSVIRQKQMKPKNLSSERKIFNNSDIEESFVSAKTNNTSTRIEKEMQKKAKTILRKNVIGRYKNSPYLNNFNKI